MLPWSVNKTSKVQADLRISYSINPEWEQWGLVCADVHLDNPHCLRDLHKHHLEQAKERNAFVQIHGDLFDAMQGKQDKRSNKSDLDMKLKSGTYLNDLVQFAFDFYEPYLQNLALISEGNHETSVTNRYEYSLLDGLVHDLRKSGSPVIRGGYRGWLKYMFTRGESGHKNSKMAYYLHGSGGGGPVTKGVIQTNRRAVYLPDADIVYSGHIHESWIFPIERVRINKEGEERSDKQYHVQLPTYKDEFMNEGGGWHHETGKPPKPVGAWWVRFYYSKRSDRVEVQFLEADR